MEGNNHTLTKNEFNPLDLLPLFKWALISVAVFGAVLGALFGLESAASVIAGGAVSLLSLFVLAVLLAASIHSVANGGKGLFAPVVILKTPITIGAAMAAAYLFEPVSVMIGVFAVLIGAVFGGQSVIKAQMMRISQ